MINPRRSCRLDIIAGAAIAPVFGGAALGRCPWARSPPRSPRAAVCAGRAGSEANRPEEHL